MIKFISHNVVTGEKTKVPRYFNNKTNLFLILTSSSHLDSWNRAAKSVNYVYLSADDSSAMMKNIGTQVFRHPRR